ncbi:unnamed protein product, partial [Eruca vesicaria subsp. sativa]|nr:unnamed protein product [Eruca vesicaria subsp. sativa]
MVEGILSKAFWVVYATVFAAATVVYGQQVPCYFIFGDSTFDSGNNNNLQSKAKVNYSPYGIDFPEGPTGRDFIPPFAGASPKQAHIGMNYASGGGGLRKETSKHLGGRISLRKQIQNHKKAIKKAKVPVQRLEQCLYTINIGSNDYINNYFMSELYNTSSLFDPNEYAYSLNRLYRTHLKRLHSLGARKIALFSISLIGCTPKMIVSHGGGQGCAKDVNAAVAIFNNNLKDLVNDFNKNFKGAEFTYVDIFSAGDPLAFARLGFKVGDKGCCTLSPGEELCVPNKPVCANRSEYLFWDDIHSSEATNKMAAIGSFYGPL